MPVSEQFLRRLHQSSSLHMVEKVHAFYFCCSECFPCMAFSGCSIATKHLALTMLRTCISDLHVYTLQVLFIFMVLSLALGLVPFFLKNLTVLDQKPLFWSVDISLHLDFLPVDTLRMLVWNVLVRHQQIWLWVWTFICYFCDNSCHLYFQTSMNAALPMEAVNRSVPILLVALSATVLQDTSWMETDLTALVSNLHYKKCYFCRILY